MTGEYVSAKEEINADATKKVYAIQFTNGVADFFYAVANLVDPKKSHTDAFSLSYRSIEANALFE